MISEKHISPILLAILTLAVARPAVAQDSTDLLPDNDVIMRALVDELQRSMSLQLEDLEKPYFIQFTVEDSIFYQMEARYGSLVSMDRDRSRQFYGQARVGDYQLDNTNFSAGRGFFGGGGGGVARTSLPLDDDYTAIRQLIWWAIDDNYKDAVETLTKKRAYMKDKTFEDRPADFTSAPAVQVIEPGAELSFERTVWEGHLKTLSARFKQFSQIQDSSVTLFVGAGNHFVVNSEGTQLRTGDSGALLLMTAEGQCDDGMRMSSAMTFTGDHTSDLPAVDRLLDSIDRMVQKLDESMKAPVLERYTGPVWFDQVASCQLFKDLLSTRIAGQPEEVGSQRRRVQDTDTLEHKLDTRILPRSFQVYDDPTVRTAGDQLLFGSYRYDDEGMPAQRVEVIVDGILQNLVLARAPTKKRSGSNGHGRRGAGGGSVQATIGSLFIQDDDGVSDAELKKELLDLAKDEGLEYGIRVTALRGTTLGSSQSDLLSLFMARQQGRGGLSDPIRIHKVYVADGREEPVRGCEFGAFDVRDLKKIAAAGSEPYVYNFIDLSNFGGASPPSSIIAPAVLLEDVELVKIEQELDKQPILGTPLSR